jgi:hypothetical protein
MTRAASPIDKLKAVVDTFEVALRCIGEHYERIGRAAPGPPGADTTWPIFQYILIKAAVPRLMSEVMCVKDFFDRRLEDLEGYSYRLMILEANLDLIAALQWGVTDGDGVLIPVIEEGGGKGLA